MSLAIITNSDAGTQVRGSVVRRGTTANTCLLAQADTLVNCQDLLGTRLADVLTGAGGVVGRITHGACVALEGVVSAGDAIYLSATTAGRGTNVVPLIKVLLGYAYDVVLVGGTYYAQLIIFTTSLGTDGLVLPTQLPSSILAETYYFPSFVYPPEPGGIYSGTHVLNPRTRAFFFWITGAGGGGGGAVGGAAGNVSVGSGGGGGGYVEGTIVVVPGVMTVDWVLGAGGTASLGGAGGNGGTSTLTYNGSAIATCAGGSGGQVMSSGNTPATIAGGALGNATPTASIVVPGSNGTSGYRWSGTVALAGMGGTTGLASWSGGSREDPGDGENGLRHGGGGAGANATTVSMTGGPGRDGGLVIREFS